MLASVGHRTRLIVVVISDVAARSRTGSFELAGCTHHAQEVQHSFQVRSHLLHLCQRTILGASTKRTLLPHQRPKAALASSSVALSRLCRPGSPCLPVIDHRRDRSKVCPAISIVTLQLYLCFLLAACWSTLWSELACTVLTAAAMQCDVQTRAGATTMLSSSAKVNRDRCRYESKHCHQRISARTCARNGARRCD